MKEKPEGIRTGDDWLVDQRCEEVQFRATKSGTDIRTLFCHSDIELLKQDLRYLVGSRNLKQRKSANKNGA